MLWGEINSAYQAAEPMYPGRCLTKTIEIEKGSHYGFGYATDEPINLLGFHSENLLVVVDEAAGVKLDTFDSLDRLLTSEGSRRLYIGNPDFAAGRFFESFSDKNFNKFTISAFETPNFTSFGVDLKDIENGDWFEKTKNKEMPYPFLITPLWVAEQYNKWGVDSPLFQSGVLAEFPEKQTDGLIPLSYLLAAKKRELCPDGDIAWGLDVARFGRDRSVLRKRMGGAITEKRTFVQQSAPELADWVEGIIKEKNELIVVDSVGIGSGVVDILKTKGYRNIYEYTGKPTPRNPDFINERAIFYWNLRQRLTDGDISGLDDEDISELASIKYSYKGGKIQIEEKDAIRKRIGKSPDCADSLMLCFAKVKRAFTNFSMKGVSDLKRISPNILV